MFRLENIFYLLRFLFVFFPKLSPSPILRCFRKRLQFSSLFMMYNFIFYLVFSFQDRENISNNFLHQFCDVFSLRNIFILSLFLPSLITKRSPLFVLILFSFRYDFANLVFFNNSRQFNHTTRTRQWWFFVCG